MQFLIGMSLLFVVLSWTQALLATRGLERPCEQCLERESDSVCKECCSVAETPFCNQCWEECHETGALSSHVRHFYAQGLRARLDRLKVLLSSGTAQSEPYCNGGVGVWSCCRRGQCVRLPCSCEDAARGAACILCKAPCGCASQCRLR